MKELLINKVMLGFVVFIFGILYINSISINSEIKMDEQNSYMYNK